TEKSKIPPGVPPSHPYYLDQMLETSDLLIHQPDEPIEYMINHLKRDNDDGEYRSIFFFSSPPPLFPQAVWLCKQLGTTRISQETLLFSETSQLTEKAKTHHESKQGWILEGLPKTREQALLLQSAGIIPRHVVVLCAPDIVLIERNLGKRVDPFTGEVYHTTFDWPSDPLVQERLEVPTDISEQETSKQLLEFHRSFPGLFHSYQKILRSINADQPCADVFSQALTYVQSQHRSTAPFTPRILFCGPPGSGKSLQAALIAQKYGIVNLCCGQLLKEAVAGDTNLGVLIKPYFDSGWPVSDNIVLKILTERLNRLDCVTNGWVLHGFPRDLEQAEKMGKARIIPNRVIFLNLPYESIMERLTQRRVDPVTGERLALMLHQNPKDAEENVKVRLENYYRHATGMETFFEDAFYVNADQDPHVVFEYIESYVVNPLPVTC
uniref:Adenylate kinase 8 n=1 Tax=Sphenodon punctatus TaxID=8508 RepID=A0A8D0HHF9_SPHPU